MKKLLLTLTLQAVFVASCSSCSTDDPANNAPVQNYPDTSVLEAWRVGDVVSVDAVEAYGVDNCFAADTIADSTFQRMWKKSYKENCTIPRSDLRYVRVLHYTLDGQIKLGELVCNRAIAKDLVEIFHDLYNAKYPIERIELVDNYNAEDEKSMTANNTSCFNFRFISGTTKLSNHSRGCAIDINTLYNPYVKTRTDGTIYVEPEAGRPYADRTKTFDYKITHDDLCYKLFKQHGFDWGGDWTSVKDYQHFEKTIE